VQKYDSFFNLQAFFKLFSNLFFQPIQSQNFRRFAGGKDKILFRILQIFF